MQKGETAFYKNGIFHIYNRTLESLKLCYSNDNYFYLTTLIQKYRIKYGVDFLAYCLMPNHYHFMLRQTTEIPLSRFLSDVFNSYAQALNRQIGRKGPIFEDRPKYKHIDDERYLRHICRYIHLNPVKAGLVKNVHQWPFSNYLEWIGKRKGTLMDLYFIAELFPESEQYKLFVEDLNNDRKLAKLEDYLMD
jgi:putative transposase